MAELSDVRRGMTILGRDGRKLGRVVSVGPEGVDAKRGFLIRRRFHLRPEEITSVGERTVTVRRTGLDLEPRALEQVRIDTSPSHDHPWPDGRHGEPAWHWRHRR